MSDQPTDQANDQVVDDDRPTNQPPDADDQPATDQQTTPPPLTLDEAALELGITVNAVRQRIKRGTLIGIKTDAGWLVATNQESGADRPTTRPTNHTSSVTDHQPTIDLAPLVSHIATLEDQVQRLTEASTMWQIRARQAEEQLLQLPAGTTDSDIEPEPNTVDAEGLQLLQTSDPAPTGVLAWWKRLWSG